MIGRSVLIVGNGVAGPALAHWLLHHGFSPTIVERAPTPRSGGYVIDFWGQGYDLVERMGLLPELRRASLPVHEVRLVGANGKKRGGFDAKVFSDVTNGRYLSLPRSALSSILYDAVAPKVRTIWDDEPIGLEQRAQGVWVTFRRREPELFNVVVGADGLHSRVRHCIFGDSGRFEHSLGYRAAAFETVGYEQRDESVYVSFAAPGRQVARFALPDDRTMFLLVVADAASAPIDSSPDAAKHYMRQQFANSGWELPKILDKLDQAEHVYFDDVSQVRMPRWSRGAVALVGDAAYAPSLLAGQGSALAVIGAYVLAGELSRGVIAEGAFDGYEARLRSFIQAKQDSAAKFAASFAPRSQLTIFLRNLATRGFAIPRLARSILGRQLNDQLDLPDYAPGLGRSVQQ